MRFSIWQRRQAEYTGGVIPPVRAEMLARKVVELASDDTLGKAAHLFRTERIPVLPVVEDGILVGLVDEDGICQLLSEGTDADACLVRDAMTSVEVLVPPFATAAQVEMLLREAGCSVLPVGLPGGAFVGMVSRSEVVAALSGRLAPRIGGMATPLGVYLTSGTVSGGASWLGLLLTGALMGAMIWVAQTGLLLLAAWIYHMSHWSFFLHMSYVVADAPISGISPLMQLMVMMLGSVLLMAVFLGLLRIMPWMAGFHAAEHQTVNAIEAGEPLTPERVSRMSRVHPRCGTNLWGLMALTYLGVTLLVTFLAQPIVRTHVSLLVLFVYIYALFVAVSWRRFGGWVQQHLTTRRAKPAEIESGIRAGAELLLKHRQRPAMTLRPAQRILRMGLAQVLCGALLVESLLHLFDPALDVMLRYLLK